MEILGRTRHCGLSRNPQKAEFADGIEVVRGDLTAPDTLDCALNDVEAKCLVWRDRIRVADAA